MSASRRFKCTSSTMYGKVNRGYAIGPLYRGCPLLGGSVIRGSAIPYLTTRLVE